MSGQGDVEALRKQIEELQARVAESADSARLLASVLEAAPVFVMRVDAEGRAVFLNRFAPGFTPEDTYGRPFQEFVSLECRDRAWAAFRRVMETGEVTSYETAVPLADGTHWFITRVAAVNDDEGRQVGATLVSTDITDQRQREQAVAERDAKLQLAVRATGMGLWSWDLRTNHVEWNAEMHAITGSPVPLDPDGYLHLVHPDDRAEVEARAEHFKQKRVYDGRAHRIVRPDGSVRWVMGAAQIIAEDEDRPLKLVGGTLDVTELRAAEEQRVHGMKMQALGQLASGIAHNFNNMLATITPTLDLLSGNVGDRYQALVDGASHASDRASELVRQLMAFAGRGLAPSDERPVRADEVARRAVSMCRLAFGSYISVSENYAAPDAWVGSVASLEQALVNILINARDALAEAGTEHPMISLSTEGLSATAPVASGLGSAGPFVRFRVEDNGPGMSEEVIQRIFEPFFTTKGVGRGTGLGLATAFAVVSNAGGTIVCRSEPGRGTTFDVIVPLADADATDARSAVVPSGAPARRRLTVLVVDDEITVRRATHMALTRAGHRVLEAATVAEAAETLSATVPDVLLLDQSLPDGQGPELLERFPELTSKTRVLVFSGQGVSDDVAARVHGVLIKPLGAARIVEAVEAQSPAEASPRRAEPT